MTADTRVTGPRTTPPPADSVDVLAGVRWERVRYVGADGRVAEDIGTVVGPQAPVSRIGLAAQFDNPAQDLAFSTVTPWHGVSVERTLVPWQGADPAATVDLRPAFEQAVRAAVGDSDRVAVSFSGGLDSLLLVATIARLLPERRLVVVVADLLDDLGASSAAQARELLAAFAVEAAVHVVPETVEPPATAAWSLLGPRGDALPDVNARIAAVAERAGADRLIVGSGADEVLHVGSFVLPGLLAAGRSRALRRFLADLDRYSGLLGFGREAAALLSRRLPLDRSFDVAFSLLFPGVLRSVPAGLLPPELHDELRTIRRTWVEGERRLFEAHDFDWADYAALHAICPRPSIPAANALPVHSPFTDPAFCAAAEQLPLHRRYDETLPTPYQRMKSQVVGLFPEEQRSRLPARKQTYGRALARASARRAAAGLDRCYDAGVLVPGSGATLQARPDLQLTAVAVEEWLAGAADRGHPLG